MPAVDDRFGKRLSDNSERLYESDNCVLGQPHRSATDGRSGASETEMTQRSIDSEQLSRVVDRATKENQAATLSSVVVSSSVTLMPSLNV